jgi:class 3 adenylate cyclase
MEGAGACQGLSNQRQSAALSAGFAGRLYLSSAWDFGLDQIKVRRLAAILAADVVGYSRLMAADEKGTHASRRCARTSSRRSVSITAASPS